MSLASFLQDQEDLIITQVNDAYNDIFKTYDDDCVHPYNHESMKLTDDLFDISHDIFNEGRTALESVKKLYTKMYYNIITVKELHELDKLVQSTISNLLIARVLFYNHMKITQKN